MIVPSLIPTAMIYQLSLALFCGSQSSLDILSTHPHPLSSQAFPLQQIKQLVCYILFMKISNIRGILQQLRMISIIHARFQIQTTLQEHNFNKNDRASFHEQTERMSASTSLFMYRNFDLNNILYNLMQKKPNYLIPRIQHQTVIHIDADSASDHSDISEEEPNQAIPELGRSQKINNFRLIQPVHRIRESPQPIRLMKRQLPIEVDESEESVSESHALQFISEQRPIKNDYRPLKRRLIKAANKCKIQRRQFSSTQCSICLTNIENKLNNQIGKLPCHHAFCFDCIYESSKFANKCPYCRSSYRQIQRGQEFIPVEQKSREEMQAEDQPCYICGRNDDFDHLLECEYCESAFCHTYCDNRLSSDIPPQESWYCLSCSEIIANQIEEIQ